MKKRTVQLAVMALLTVCIVSAQSLAPTQAQTPAKPSAQIPAPNAAKSPAKVDPWAGLRFLIGSWEAKTTGGVAQAQASAGYSFRLELREHVLARHSRSGSCSAPEDFNCQHSDLLYIYPTGNGSAFEAIYFDNEGHVIHYGVTTPKPGTVVFLSDPAQPGPQYRLNYTFLDGVMSDQFELKMPGQTDFTSYLEWSGKWQ
jgi:hypothetical protein